MTTQSPKFSTRLHRAILIALTLGASVGVVGTIVVLARTPSVPEAVWAGPPPGVKLLGGAAQFDSRPQCFTCDENGDMLQVNGDTYWYWYSATGETWIWMCGPGGAYQRLRRMVGASAGLETLAYYRRTGRYVGSGRAELHEYALTSASGTPIR